MCAILELETDLVAKCFAPAFHVAGGSCDRNVTQFLCCGSGHCPCFARTSSIGTVDYNQLVARSEKSLAILRTVISATNRDDLRSFVVRTLGAPLGGPWALL